jgi:hypothetical protein
VTGQIRVGDVVTVKWPETRVLETLQVADVYEHVLILDDPKHPPGMLTIIPRDCVLEHVPRDEGTSP